MNDWKSVLFSTKGRIRRSQYWAWSLGISFSWIVLFFIVMAFDGGFTQEASQATPSLMTGLYMLVSYPLLIWTSVCIVAKRWHDRDKSAWMMLIAFIPIVGGIWALIECGFLDGTQGPNQYGPSPKGIGTAETIF